MKYFHIDEFACKHCGENKTDTLLMNLCDKGRELTGIPWRVNSGYRCPTHNKAIGSTSDVHPKGLAVDIDTPNSTARFKILEVAMQLGFKRIGVAKTFIHLDIDHTKFEEVTWIY